MIAPKASMWPGFGGRSDAVVPDRLHARLFIIGDDRDGLPLSARCLSRGGLFKNSDLAVNAQDLRHFLRRIGVAALQIIAHLVRLHFLLVEDLAQRALRQIGEAGVSLLPAHVHAHGAPAAASSTIRADSRVPSLYGTQRHQPAFRFDRNRRLPAGQGDRPAPPKDQRQPPSQRSAGPSDDAIPGFAHGKKARLIPIGEENARPLDATRRRRARARDRCQLRQFFIVDRQRKRLSPRNHASNPSSRKSRARLPTTVPERICICN